MKHPAAIVCVLAFFGLVIVGLFASAVAQDEVPPPQEEAPLEEEPAALPPVEEEEDEIEQMQETSTETLKSTIVLLKSLCEQDPVACVDIPTPPPSALPAGHPTEVLFAQGCHKGCHDAE